MIIKPAIIKKFNIRKGDTTSKKEKIEYICQKHITEQEDINQTLLLIAEQSVQQITTQIIQMEMQLKELLKT